MTVSDDESRERVKRHRERRAGYSFKTIECPVDLADIAMQLPENSNVLLECAGNLAANEFFRYYEDEQHYSDGQYYKDEQLYEDEQHYGDGQYYGNRLWDRETECREAKERILNAVKILSDRCSDLVIVSNEVNRAGCEYEGDTRSYQKLLGELNQSLCALADTVVEMVYGCPVYRKQAVRCHENNI